jgi:hypothetical protein
LNDLNRLFLHPTQFERESFDFIALTHPFHLDPRATAAAHHHSPAVALCARRNSGNTIRRLVSRTDGLLLSKSWIDRF